MPHAITVTAAVVRSWETVVSPSRKKSVTGMRMPITVTPTPSLIPDTSVIESHHRATPADMSAIGLPAALSAIRLWTRFLYSFS